jgi:ferredoxin
MGILFPQSISAKIESNRLVKPVKRPTIDLGACTKCGGCVEVAPKIFKFNDAAGYLEVCELKSYDQELVDEAIKYCPEDCIEWEDY